MRLTRVVASIAVVGAVLALAFGAPGGAALDHDGVSVSSDRRGPKVAPTQSDTTQVCAALSKIRDLDAQVQRAITAKRPWRELKPFLLAVVKKTRRTYSTAARQAPGTTKADIEEVASFTNAQVQTLRSASSQQAFARNILADPSTRSAGLAAQRVNKFSNSTCGFAPRSTK